MFYPFGTICGQHLNGSLSSLTEASVCMLMLETVTFFYLIVVTGVYIRCFLCSSKKSQLTYYDLKLQSGEIL